MKMDYEYFTSYVWMRKQRQNDLMFILYFMTEMTEDQVIEFMTALKLGNPLPPLPEKNLVRS